MVTKPTLKIGALIWIIMCVAIISILVITDIFLLVSYLQELQINISCTIVYACLLFSCMPIGIFVVFIYATLIETENYNYPSNNTENIYNHFLNNE